MSHKSYAYVISGKAEKTHRREGRETSETGEGHTRPPSEKEGVRRGGWTLSGWTTLVSMM